MPPVHPDLVHFPIALLTVAFAADVWGFLTRRPAVRGFAWGCLVLGFLGLLGAAVTGWIDMERANLAHETHELVDLHWRVGVVLAVVTTALLAWRWRLGKIVPSRAQSGVYLASFAVVFALLCVQGWFGGEIAYAHGAGVAATNQGMVPREQAARRVEPLARALTRIPGFREEEHEQGGEPERPRTNAP